MMKFLAGLVTGLFVTAFVLYVVPAGTLDPTAPALRAAGAAVVATPQVGFSPEGSARAVVLNVVNSAQHDIRMLAYSFTARDIAAALLAAKRRGVDVRVVADASEARDRAEIEILNRLASAGIPVRIDSAFKIQHDKVLVVDGRTVETGSFNYSYSAERENSENAVVLWNDPDFARPFLAHWESRWNDSAPYQAGY